MSDSMPNHISVEDHNNILSRISYKDFSTDSNGKEYGNPYGDIEKIKENYDETFGHTFSSYITENSEFAFRKLIFMMVNKDGYQIILMN